MKMQPDLAYIGEDGKLHDDGLHDEMLTSEAGQEASRKAARAFAPMSSREMPNSCKKCSHKTSIFSPPFFLYIKYIAKKRQNSPLYKLFFYKLFKQNKPLSQTFTNFLNKKALSQAFTNF